MLCKNLLCLMFSIYTPARKSSHHFDSADQGAREMIENDMRVFVPDHTFSEEYFFNYTKRE